MCVKQSQAPLNLIRNILKPQIHSLSFLYSCTPKEIEDIIDLLDSAKVCGPYSIPVKLLKILGKQISIPLSDLINSSLTTGTFPTKLKVSKFNPLYKKGSNLDPNNYHPINLTPFSI